MMMMTQCQAHGATTSAPDQGGPITCYSCYNCLTFEAKVQFKQCAPEEQYCSVSIIAGKDCNGFDFWQELGWMTCSRVKCIYFWDLQDSPNNFCFVKYLRKAQNITTCLSFGVMNVAQL